MTIKKKSRLIAEKLPSYKTPPVNEVVIGFSATNLPEFKIPHLGLFWDRFRNRYPLIEHAPPLQTKDGLLIDSVTGLPFPRVWFLDKTETRLVQLQSNAFYFNWRNRKEDDEYPRYENIKKEFQENVNLFVQFLSEMQLGTLNPLECQLTYINHIPKGQGWETIDDLPNVLNDCLWIPKPDRFLPKPINLSWQSRFSLPGDNGLLQVRLTEAKRRTDSLPVIVLELSASGIGEQKSLDGIWDWYSVAHEWIVRGFADLTTPVIQREHWKREDVTRS